MYTSRPRHSLWLSPRSTGSLARLRRCFAVRLVATVIAGLLFGGSAPQVWAFPADRPGPWLPATGPMPWRPASPPPRPVAAKSPPARTLVPTRLTPVGLECIDGAGAPLRTGAADDPWLAFDRDPSTALVSRDGQPVRLRASFHAARKLTGVLLQGQGGGTLSLFERRPSGAHAIPKARPTWRSNGARRTTGSSSRPARPARRRCSCSSGGRRRRAIAWPRPS